MSFIDDKIMANSNYNFSHQNEEHFEFTPNLYNNNNDNNCSDATSLDDFNDSIDASNNFINGYSSNNMQTLINGDDDYTVLNNINDQSTSSIKLMSRNSLLNSSIRKSTPIKNRNSINNSNLLNGSNYMNDFDFDSDYQYNHNHNDNSMEGYILHLTEKIKKLHDQVQFLREGQQKNEEKYSTMYKENSSLHNKIDYLEEQIRDIELQSEDKRKEVEQRFRESMARLEREKSQELENCVTRICLLQKESIEAKEEIKRNQQIIERLQIAKENLESELNDKNDEIQLLKDEIRKLEEIIRLKNEAIDSSLIEVINNELSTIGCDHHHLDNNNHQHFSNNNSIPFETDNELYNSIQNELELKLRMLKEENKLLKENNEELTAQVLNNHLIEGKSLLKEGEAISSLASEISDLNIEQLKTALKEQQDVNAKLRAYIDGILLNIVENYPQLLEVKSNGKTNGTTAATTTTTTPSTVKKNGSRKKL